MTTPRSILLPLGPSTTDTLCGDCPFLSPATEGDEDFGWPDAWCMANVFPEIGNRLDGGATARRHDSCIDREQAASRLLDVSPVPSDVLEAFNELADRLPDDRYMHGLAAKVECWLGKQNAMAAEAALRLHAAKGEALRG